MTNVTEEQRIEILDQRDTWTPTRRVCAGGLEDLLYFPVPVLDHGIVRVIDYMGDDTAIVQAARVSYGRGTRKVSENTGLIRYLMRHRHSTPFEMCEIKLHVKLPVFVARQWIRHRTANVNEYSARYSVLDREFYIPEPEQLSAQSLQNRQGRAETLDEDQAQTVLDILKEDATRNYDHYLWMLNEQEDGEKIDDSRTGLARELARMNLTLNTYTQWYWKCDLWNLLNFLSLRADSHAQYEIRVYAEAMLDIVKAWVPIAYQAFLDYRLGAFTLSSQMLRVVQAALSGSVLTRESSGLNAREWEELNSVLSVTR
jgi:thymidylate synthase (FAD)